MTTAPCAGTVNGAPRWGVWVCAASGNERLASSTSTSVRSIEVAKNTAAPGSTVRSQWTGTLASIRWRKALRQIPVSLRGCAVRQDFAGDFWVLSLQRAAQERFAIRPGDFIEASWGP